MKWLTKQIPEVLDVCDTILDIEISKDFSDVLKIGPVKIEGTIYNKHTAIETDLNISATLLMLSDNLDEVEEEIFFNLSLVFEDSIRGDYKLSEFRDLVDIIRGNIYIEKPLYI